MKTNSVTLIGFVGSDLSSKRLADGSKLVILRVSTSQSAITKDGETIRQTQWHDVVAFDDLGDIAENSFVKGSHIMVNGSIEYSTWQDVNGNKRHYARIRASELINLDR